MKIVNSFATIYENISHPSDISGLFEIRDDHQARSLSSVQVVESVCTRIYHQNVKGRALILPQSLP
jgi:hypothetical protein